MLDRSTVVQRLTAWVVELVPECSQLGVDEDTSLSQFAGFDSIAIVQLLARAEDDFDVDLAGQDETILSAGSIGSLTDSIMRLSGGPQ